ncbi:hypothetical protein V5799_032557 [Amblyomma americanum]|uniref:Neurotransmitter-gated ion-channel ligand-binding domain-containing protein n=1 Tax=Amblyomma americanum TaxID=6943 RepID=A0AAQ4DQU4_AMBAM
MRRCRGGSYAYANLTVDEVTTKVVVLGSGYKKYVAPSQAGEPAQVYLDMSLMNVDPLSGAENEFGLLALVRLRWRDPRLNLSFFRKNSFLALPSYLEDEIWTPRLAFLDASENQRAWSAQKLAEDIAASDASRRSSDQVYVADGYRLTHEAETQTPPDVGLDEALHDRRAWLVFFFGFPLVTLVYWAYYLAASH